MGRKHLELPPLGYGAPDPTTAKGKADEIRFGAAYQAAETVVREVREGKRLDNPQARNARANEVYRKCCEEHGLNPGSDANVRKMRGKWNAILARDLTNQVGMTLEQYVSQFVVIPDDKLRSDLLRYATDMMVRVLEHKNREKADARQIAVKAYVSWALRSYRTLLVAKWGKATRDWSDDPGAIPTPSARRVVAAWKIVRETLPAGDDRTAFLTAAQEQLGPEPARNIVHT